MTTVHTAAPMSGKRAEVFCEHLDDWLDGGADSSEQLAAINMRNQGMSMQDVVAVISEERALAKAGDACNG